LPVNYEPLFEEGRVEVVEDGAGLVPSVRYVHTRGHTPHHQSVLIDVGETRLLYLADLAPTRAHLPLPWIMGYDLEPMHTLESKRTLLTRAGQEGWLLGFEHDPSVAWGRAVPLEDAEHGCGLVDEIDHPCR